LGAGADHPGRSADYASFFVETPAIYRLRCSPSLVKSFQGGRWMVKPALSYEFSKTFHVGLDGRFILGSASGPLAATPTQWWFSATVAL